MHPGPTHALTTRSMKECNIWPMEMKLMAWTRPMKKTWKLLPYNQPYEKAVKTITVEPNLWKSHENCPPTTPMKMAWKLIVGLQPPLWKCHENGSKNYEKLWKWSHVKRHENTMKLQTQRKLIIINNTTVGSMLWPSSSLLGACQHGYFLLTWIKEITKQINTILRDITV